MIRTLAIRALAIRTLAIRTLALVACLLLPVAATAATPALSAEDRADIARVEAYFNALSTMRSTFIQASSTGRTAKGTVWLNRPGRMRFEYDPPVPVLITADGLLLTYQDRELEQTNQIPLATTPLAVLVDERVRLGDELVVDAVARGANVLRIRMHQRDEPDQGHVILVFQDKPLSLKQWTIVDAQGVEVRVALLDPVFGLDLPAKLFQPDVFTRQADEIGR